MKKLNLLIALIVLAASFASFALENAGDACLSNDGSRGEASTGSTIVQPSSDDAVRQ